ncbi:MAG: hypothetical protein FJ104_01210 [Deltaproteobacteria bacterium]|nr:hypothetical protein [Deltaproteobacteria bacterium]
MEVSFDGASARFPLHDISASGVAVVWGAGPAPALGDRIASVVVGFDDHVAYRGPVRVASIRDLGGTAVVGFAFTGGLVDVAPVLELRDSIRQMASSVPRGGARSWYVEGAAEWKACVGDLRLLFEDARARLDELDASLPCAHAESNALVRGAMEQWISAEIVPALLDGMDAVHAALPAARSVPREALAEYSRRHLDAFILESRCARRALEKPLGYPGDYQLMVGVYGPAYVGPTLFARAMNALFVSTPGARAVRARKDLVRRELAERVARGGAGERPIRILSIASGPAEETYELLLGANELTRPLEIVLFEQDQSALSYCHARLEPLVSRCAGRVRVRYVHDTIKRLLRDPAALQDLGAFDVVFSCGLFDYLPRRSAAALTGVLWSHLAEGGSLYIGNMVPSSPSRWMIEFHCDWHLIYREHDEMLDFARAGAPDASAAILVEPTGVNPLVVLRRS